MKDPSPEILATGIKAEWAKEDKERANTAKTSRRNFLWPESATSAPADTGGKKGGKKGEKDAKPARVRPVVPGSPPRRIRGGFDQKLSEIIPEETRQIELDRLEQCVHPLLITIITHSMLAVPADFESEYTVKRPQTAPSWAESSALREEVHRKEHLDQMQFHVIIGVRCRGPTRII